MMKMNNQVHVCPPLFRFVDWYSLSSTSNFLFFQIHSHVFSNTHVYKCLNSQIHRHSWLSISKSLFILFSSKNFLSIFVYTVHCSRINWSIPNCDDYISHSLVHEYLRKFSSIPSYIKGHIYVHHLIQSNCFNHYQHKDKYLKKNKNEIFHCKYILLCFWWIIMCYQYE